MIRLQREMWKNLLLLLRRRRILDGYWAWTAINSINYVHFLLFYLYCCWGMDGWDGEIRREEIYAIDWNETNQSKRDTLFCSLLPFLYNTTTLFLFYLYLTHTYTNNNNIIIIIIPFLSNLRPFFTIRLDNKWNLVLHYH